MASCPSLDPIVIAELHSLSSTKRELGDGGSFQEAEDDPEPEDWMADDEVEHAEYDDGTRERRQS
jgi:hypothetical protein